jgi:hypothetical protein
MWVADEAAYYRFDGLSWVAAYGSPGAVMALNTQSGTAYSLTAADSGRIVECANSDTITLTLPNHLGVGFACKVVQTGAGIISFSNASGALFHNRLGHYKTAGQFAECSLYVTENNDGSSAVYVLTGDTQA